MAMSTKPCMVMLRTGVDGGRYQECLCVACRAASVRLASLRTQRLSRLRLSLRKNRRRRETDSMIILQLGDRRPSARRLRIQESNIL